MKIFMIVTLSFAPLAHSQSNSASVAARLANIPSRNLQTEMRYRKMPAASPAPQSAGPYIGSSGVYKVPGNMGPNALPPFATVDPKIGKDIYIQIGLHAAMDKPNGGRDYATMPYLSLYVPFKEIAALEIDTGIAEQWWASEETQQAWNLSKSKGTVKGPLNFGARFQLLQEDPSGGFWKKPAIGIRFLVRSNTGKGLDEHRFIDAPAYTIQALLARNVYIAQNPRSLIQKIRMIAKAGFFAWQQADDSQNDAADLGLRVQTVFKNNYAFDIDIRGYVGYQEQDKPFEIAAQLTTPFGMYISGSVGLTKEAPDFTVGIGFIISFGSPWG